MVQIKGDVDHLFYSLLIDKIIRELKIKALIEKAKVVITFSKAKRIKDLGECRKIGDTIQINIFTTSLKEYYRTKKEYNYGVITTLIHEIVHAKQFIKKDLISTVDAYIYKSKKYPLSFPWEEEARRAEGLFEKIINKKGA